MRNSDLATAVHRLKVDLSANRQITIDAEQILEQVIFGLKSSAAHEELLNEVERFLVEQCSMTDSDELLREARAAKLEPCIRATTLLSAEWETQVDAGITLDQADKVIVIGADGKVGVWGRVKK